MEKQAGAITNIINGMPWLTQFFSNAPPRLLARMETIIIPQGKRIIRKGEPNPYIYILFAGSLNTINEADIPELYDLTSDPYELDNLAGTCNHAQEERELASMLDLLRDQFHDPVHFRTGTCGK